MRRRASWAAAVCAALLAGCANFDYYLQSVRGQIDILRREQPITDVLAQAGTPDALRGQLAAALEIRAYASRELALPENETFRRYADLGRPFVVYTVFATPELSLEPVEWCFPFAGCVKYRGYFSRAEADRYAATLAGQGYDVFVGGVPAYSTLGWFADPVLNTFVAYPRPELARLIFHELAHQVVYVRDDTVFNESFAVAVEREGVRRWLAAHGTEADRALSERVQSRRAEFARLVREYRARLATLYASDLPAAEQRERKSALFAELSAGYDALRTSWGMLGGADRWFGQRPNNALLASVSIYTRFVPSFEALLRRAEGDMPAFYREVKALAQLPAAEREAQLQALNVRAAGEASSRDSSTQ